MLPVYMPGNSPLSILCITLLGRDLYYQCASCVMADVGWHGQSAHANRHAPYKRMRPDATPFDGRGRRSRPLISYHLRESLSLSWRVVRIPRAHAG